MTNFRITACGGIQFVTAYANSANIAASLAKLASIGYEIENIERVDRLPENVRFDVDGRPIQYADAADASEHHLRIMEAGGWEPTEHVSPCTGGQECMCARCTFEPADAEDEV